MAFLNQQLIGICILILLIAGSGCLGPSPNSDQNTGGNGMNSNTNLELKARQSAQVYYVGYTMENGEKQIFDQTSQGNPATFQVGVGSLIKGFDDALIGMKEGEQKTIEIPPAQAYGEYDEKLVIPAPIADLNAAGIPVKVGTKVRIASGAEGEIIDVNATHAKINFNHPLAGKTLFFDLTLVKILK